MKELKEKKQNENILKQENVKEKESALSFKRMIKQSNKFYKVCEKLKKYQPYENLLLTLKFKLPMCLQDCQQLTTVGGVKLTLP